jgi:hypothetical protein
MLLKSFEQLMVLQGEQVMQGTACRTRLRSFALKKLVHTWSERYLPNKTMPKLSSGENGHPAFMKD